MTRDYQRAVRALVRYADGPERLGHLALELASEAGEVANEVKKVYRDDGGRLSDERRARLLDELGDVLWAAVALIDACGGDEGSVRGANVAKLTRRMVERGRLAPEEAAAITGLMGEGGRAPARAWGRNAAPAGGGGTAGRGEEPKPRYGRSSRPSKPGSRPAAPKGRGPDEREAFRGPTRGKPGKAGGGFKGAGAGRGNGDATSKQAAFRGGAGGGRPTRGGGGGQNSGQRPGKGGKRR